MGFSPLTANNAFNLQHMWVVTVRHTTVLPAASRSLPITVTDSDGKT